MDRVLTVFIADDDDFFRTGIELVINSEEDMKVIGASANGIDALHKIGLLQPDIVLMDIKMPKMNGIECIKKLKELYPDILILILTTFNEEDFIIEGLVNGANGYLIKGIDFYRLLNTIRDCYKGHYLLPVEVATKLAKFVLEKVSNEKKAELPEYIYSSNSFTKKEQEILKLLIKRLTNKEISMKLYISEGTLKNYLTTIYQKLGVTNRHEAIAILNRQVK